MVSSRTREQLKRFSETGKDTFPLNTSHPSEVSHDLDTILGMGEAHTATEYDPDSLKTLMVTPFYGDGGGVGTVAIELSDKLREKGHIVDVLNWWPGFNKPTFIESDGTQIPLYELEDLFNLNKDYDVIHFHSDAFSDNNNGRLSDIMSRFKAPSIFTVHALSAYHGEAMNIGFETIQEQIGNQLDVIAKTDKTIMLTEGIMDIATRYHPEFVDKYIVRNNGIDIPNNSAETSSKVEELKSRYGINETDKVLLFMGRLSQEKGIVELAEAFPQIKKENPESRLVIAGNREGDSYYLPKIESILRNGGLIEGRDYTFAGWVEGIEKDALYELSDFVILPSYYEHMPMTALEGMARKKPVIISDLESINGIFKLPYADQRIALPISRIADPDAIVEAVNYALRNPEAIEGIVQRAYDRVVTNLSWDNVADEHLRLYKDLIGSTQSPNGHVPSFDERFQSEFEAQFRRDFEERLANGLNGNHPGEDYGQRIKGLREKLQIDKYNPQNISQIQELSERLRLQLDGKQDAPEVSVVIPVYLKQEHPEGLDYLFEAVDSALNQDFDKPYDIIVVDDFSQINVAEALFNRYNGTIKEIKDEEGNVHYQGKGKIKIIKRHSKSGNGQVPRNRGYQEALESGSKYISHFDSDDVMMPDRLSKLYQHLESSPTTDMVHAAHVSVDGDGNRIYENNDIDGWFNYSRIFTMGIDPNDPENQGKSVRHGTEQLEELMEGGNFVHNATTMFKTNVLLRMGLDNLSPTRNFGDDYEFWQKLGLVATMDYLNNVVAQYRQHSGNMNAGAR